MAESLAVTITPTELGCDDYETGDGTGYVACLSRANGEIVCSAQYEDRDDHLWLRWIETIPTARRRGLARELLAAMQAAHPHTDGIFTADFTPDGEALRGLVHQD